MHVAAPAAAADEAAVERDVDRERMFQSMGPLYSSAMEVAIDSAGDARAGEALAFSVDGMGHDAFLSEQLPAVSREPRTKTRRLLPAKALDNPVDRVVRRFLDLFETLRFSPPNDQYEAVGRARLVRKLLPFVINNKRIDLILPAFPCECRCFV